LHRYQNIVANTEKKKYDVLDHRKAEFETDYNDFCRQVEALQQTLQEFLDNWFSRPLTTEYLLRAYPMSLLKHPYLCHICS